MSDWQIKSRSSCCARKATPFAEGDPIYTLLFRDQNGFTREDISEAAWLEAKDSVQPYSFWRSKYEPPPPAPAPPASLAKESAETLLRRLIEEARPDLTNARYVVALMLERKRILKQVDSRNENDEKVLIYEHTKTGEVFFIPDPQLKLDQLDAVQAEVYAWLAPEAAPPTTANGPTNEATQPENNREVAG
jgi:hypothetical protein